MANKSIIAATAITFAVAVPTTYAGEQSTQMWKWWDQSHKQRRVEQQQEVITEIKLSACQQDIERWNEKLVAEPNSLYYQYKREQATKACIADDNEVLLPF